MLRIYISQHCYGYDIARLRAARLRRHRPEVPVAVVDVDEPGIEVPAKVIGTPIYTWNDRIVFMGNPSEEELLARVAGLHGRDEPDRAG
jgi:hypothetical protein